MQKDQAQHLTISRIYDAVLENHDLAWRQLLGHLITYVGGHAGWISILREGGSAPEILTTIGVPVDEAARLCDRMIESGTETPGVALCTIEVDGASVVLFVRCRKDDRASDAFSPIEVHLCRAVRLLLHGLRTVAESSAMLEVLDHMRVGIFLLRSDLRVWRSNQAARRVLDTGALVLHEDQLVAGSRMTAEPLRQALSIADGTAVAVHRPGAPPLLAKVHPISAGRNTPGARAMLVKDPAAHVIPERTALRTLYGFSEAEARLAQAITRGQSLNDYAGENGFKLSYVQKLSKRTLRRIDVGQRVDLVCLVQNSTF